MPISQNGKVVSEELFKSLESTTLLIQNLLGDIKEHSVSLAAVKTKLETLGANVEALSTVVRDGNGKSLTTRLALAERAIEHIEDEVGEIKSIIDKSASDTREYVKKRIDEVKNNELSEREYNRQKMLSHWKLVIAFAPGIVAIVLLLLK